MGELATWRTSDVLDILDVCCDRCTFPALDNGYVYLAASRLSAYRSPDEWALVIEVFGFSPRSELPDIQVSTFASRLHARDTPDSYVSENAFQRYLANNPNNESRFMYPIAPGDWQEPDNPELVALGAAGVAVRGKPRSIPSEEELSKYGIELKESPRLMVFELCRYLAAAAKRDVLATPDEQRVSVLPEMTRLLELDEWRHPDVLGGERPSDSSTFQQLAEAIVSGDGGRFTGSASPNNHWHHWPEGGSL